MKNYVLVVAFALSFVSTVSAQEVRWTSWEYVHCGNGLMLKYAKTGYNEYAKKWRWEVKFKNPTGQKIHFNFGAGPFINKGSIKTTRRMRLAPSEESDIGHSFLVDDANSVWFPVDKIRIGENDWGNYVDCHGNPVDKNGNTITTSGTTTESNTSDYADAGGIDYSPSKTTTKEKTEKNQCDCHPTRFCPDINPDTNPHLRQSHFIQIKTNLQKQKALPP